MREIPQGKSLCSLHYNDFGDFGILGWKFDGKFRWISREILWNSLENFNNKIQKSSKVAKKGKQKTGSLISYFSKFLPQTKINYQQFSIQRISKKRKRKKIIAH
jgi:hypothetical protein